MIRFYMDEHVPSPVTMALRSRGVDVLTAQEDERGGASDPAVLQRSIELGRILITFDKHFFAIVASEQRVHADFPGVVIIPRNLSYRQCIDDLELMAKCSEPAEWAGKLIRLPI
jgi:predicted nuclease of predicted toxin-antitoxin system